MTEAHPLAVVVPYWLDRPSLEALEVLHAAERAGIGAAWMGEMLSFDAFALAGAAARETNLHLTVGPLGVGIRTPVSIAMGVASLQALAGSDRVALALGSSTRAVTEGWHGRTWTDLAEYLADSTTIVRQALSGDRTNHAGALSSRGFRLGIDGTIPEIGIAAFGPKAARVAGAAGDRLVLNLVTTDQATAVIGRAQEARHGGEELPVTAWIVVAVDPDAGAIAQVRRQVALYLGAPGYGEMFIEAGFGEIVAEARSGASAAQLAARLPVELLESVAAIGGAAGVRARLDEYRRSGVTQCAVVPVTAGDAAGARSLSAVAGGDSM